MNHAARANSNAELSFAAFNVFGTLPVNQSTLTSLHASRYLCRPHKFMVEAPGAAPGSSASFSLYQQLIIYLYTV